MKNEIEVIDNFLPNYYFKQLQSKLLGEYFPWYHNEYILDKDRDKGKKSQFMNIFYDIKPQYGGETPSYVLVRDWFNVIGPKLNITRLYRIKANLRLRSFFNRSGGGYHIDPYDCSHTSIYYINTNNGYTKFKNGAKIKSVENRMVVFPSHLEHQGYACSDKLKRVVVNFNYDKF
jgi:hypothetical protein|tara:strand:- start:679 stop:1203 length:525 start_codon:yes stop_codon:yes gene_type:complete